MVVVVAFVEAWRVGTAYFPLEELEEIWGRRREEGDVADGPATGDLRLRCEDL